MASKKDNKDTLTQGTQSTEPKSEAKEAATKGGALNLAASGLSMAVNSSHLDVSIGGLNNIAAENMHLRTDLMLTSKEAGQKIGALEKVQNGLRVAIAAQTAVTLSIELETEKVKTATAAANYSGAVSDLKDAIDKAGHKETMSQVNAIKRSHLRRENIAETVIAAGRADKKEGKAEGVAANDEHLTSLYNDLKARFQQVQQGQKAKGWSVEDGK